MLIVGGADAGKTTHRARPIGAGGPKWMEPRSRYSNSSSDTERSQSGCSGSLYRLQPDEARSLINRLRDADLIKVATQSGYLGQAESELTTYWCLTVEASAQLDVARRRQTG